MARPAINAFIAICSGVLVGCSNPGFPGTKLPPVDTRAQRAQVDRSRLTLILPFLSDPSADRKQCGRVRSGQAFNFQWIVERSADKKPIEKMVYFVQLVVPQSDGKELLIASGMVGEADESERGRAAYRLGLVAPKPGTYVVRLLNPSKAISESTLEVF